MNVFLIAGKAHSGKGLVAKIIKNNLSGVSVITEYSKYLKLYAKEILGWNGDDYSKPRSFLQQLGNEIIKIKMDNKFFLINRMKDDLKIYENYVNNVIIADIRFPEEITSLSNLNYNMISINVLRENCNDDLSIDERKHYSENALDNCSFDYVIDNNGSLEELENKIKMIIGEVK